MASKTAVLGVGLALFFSALALWNVDLDKLSSSLSSANYWYLLPAAVATTLGYLLRTARWCRILRPAQAIALPGLFPVLMIGFMANNVLPARIGEVARAYVLHRRHSVSKSLGLSTIAVERLLDGLTLVLLIGVLSLWFPLPEWGIGLARLAGAVFVGGSLLVAVLLTNGKLMTRGAEWLAGRLPNRLGERANAVFANALLGLRALSRHRLLLAVAALSLMVWTAEAASYFLVIKGFNLPLAPETGWLAAIFLLVVVNLGIMLPSAPGYVGTFQAFAVLALSAFGVQKEAALGVAVVSHGMQYILVTGLGLLFLWSGQLSLTGISTE